MTSAILLLLMVLLGWGCVLYIPLKFYRVEAAALSIVLGFLLSTWILAGLSLLVPYRWSLPVGTTIIIVVTGLLFKYRSRGVVSKLPSFSRPMMLVWAAITGIITVVFGYLIAINMLLPSASGWGSAQSAYGDVALHATLANAFAADERLILRLPVLAGTRLSYPFILDFQSAVLMMSGWPLSTSLSVPGIMLAASLVQLVAFTGLRLFRSTSAGLLGCSLYFLGGSSYGFIQAILDWRASNMPLLTFLSHLPRTYGHLVDFRVQMMNPLIQLIPQRTALLGYGSLLILIVLVQQALRPELLPRERRRILAAMALLVGALPMAHIHTFLFVSLILAIAVVVAYRRRLDIRGWAWAGLAVVLLAAPQLFWQLVLSPHARIGQVVIGWHVPGESYLASWLIAFGLAGPVAVALVIWALKRPMPSSWLLVPAGVTFALCSVYITQPWGFDNMKLLGSVDILLCMFAGYGAVVMYRKPGRWRSARIIAVGTLVVLATAVGPVTFAQEAQSRNIEFTPADLQFGAWIRDHTSPKDRFVVAEHHNHPVTALAGREVLLGYTGWLWTYGIDYTAAQTDTQRIFQGAPDAAAIIAQRQIKYVALSASDAQDPRIRVEWLIGHSDIVYANPGWTLYQLR